MPAITLAGFEILNTDMVFMLQRSRFLNSVGEIMVSFYQAFQKTLQCNESAATVFMSILARGITSLIFKQCCCFLFRGDID